MSTVNVKRGDVGRTFSDTLTEAGVAADLSTATGVLFILRSPDALEPKVAAAATIVSAPAGTVKYVTVLDDLDTAGEYLQEWQVTYAGGAIATFPDEGYNRVVVEADLDQTDEEIEPTPSLTGACAPWVTWADLPCDVDLSALPGTEAAWQALILQAVSDTLYERSGRQFGLCSETARPVPCCQRHMLVPCSCGGRYDAIRLGVAPVAAITSVKIDGVTLSSSAYRVDEYEWLVRIDGDVWPRCNDLSVASTEAGTFEVTWQYGIAVPAGGILSARLYACSRAEKMVNTCAQLTGQEESVVRDGVTINLRPPKPGESLGVEYVDAWLAGFNTSGGIFAPGGHRSVWRVGA